MRIFLSWDHCRRVLLDPALLQTAKTGLLGLICGIFLLSVCNLWIASWGASLLLNCLLSGGLALGLLFGLAPASHAAPRWLGKWEEAACLFGLCVLIPCLPGVNHLVQRFLSAVPISLLLSPFAQAVFFLPVALLTLTLPVFWMTRLHLPAGRPGISLVGVSMGLILGSTLFSIWLDLQVLNIIAALIGGLLLVGELWQRWDLPARSSEVSPQPASNHRLPVSQWFPLAGVFCLGVTFAALMRYQMQFVPATAYQILACWASLLMGCAVGLGTARSSRRPGAAWSLLLAGCWGTVCLALFPLLLQGMLYTNAYVTNLILLVSLRAGLSLMMFPLGVGMIWAVLPRTASEPSTLNSPLFRIAVGCLVVGVMAARTAFHFGMPHQWVLVVGTLGLGLSACLLAWTSRKEMFTGRIPAPLWGSLTLVVFSVPIWQQQYDVGLASRLLFSTTVFLEYRNDLPYELLPVVDETRLVRSVEGTHATYSVWSCRLAQWQIRESGLPKCLMSRNTEISPQYSGEVLPALVPLAMHPAPRRVLFLEANTGLPISASLSFPVEQVYCAEEDLSYRRMLAKNIWPELQDNPWDDDRVTFWNLNSSLALLGNSEPYQVIVSCPGLPLQWKTTPQFNQGFYRQAAARLTEDGLFCQRFTFRDLGPEPIQSVSRTLQSVFRHVSALEIAPGELLFLCSNSDEGVLRPGYVERLETPQLRRLFAQMGWDWSMVLNLSAFDHTGLQGFVQSAKSAPIQTAATGEIAMSVPRDVMRWGNKTAEVQSAMQPHLRRYLEWVATRENASELEHRLKDVMQQRQLIAMYPDQHWAYRKVIKEHLTTNPRTQIQHEKGKKPRHELHPEDKRRMDYFDALNDAISTSPLTPAVIQKVERYAEPYDPLLSLFLHDEVARLYARTEHKDHAAELRHRLHTVYFSAAMDRSIRNITTSVGLLVEHPELTSPADRWDYLNSLLQMLALRWQMRGTEVPGATADILMGDVKSSLDAMDDAFETLSELTDELDIPAEEWELRQRFLERCLVSPLRQYQRQLARHSRKNASPEELLELAPDPIPPHTPGRSPSALDPLLVPTAN